MVEKLTNHRSMRIVFAVVFEDEKVILEYGLDSTKHKEHVNNLQSTLNSSQKQRKTYAHSNFTYFVNSLDEKKRIIYCTLEDYEPPAPGIWDFLDSLLIESDQTNFDGKITEFNAKRIISPKNEEVEDRISQNYEIPIERSVLLNEETAKPEELHKQVNIWQKAIKRLRCRRSVQFAIGILFAFILILIILLIILFIGCGFTFEKCLK